MRRSNRRLPAFTLALSLALALALATPALAAESGRSGGEEERGFAALTAGATLREGFFDTYEKGDHLYLAVPPERLGRELLVVPRVGRGIGAGGLYSGLMYDRVEAAVVTLVRRGERLFLEHRPHRFTGREGTPEARAAERSYGASVLASAKIEAERDDGALLVDVYSWVVSDLLNVEAYLRQGLERSGQGSGGASLDASRSYLESVKAFPRNLEIRAKLTFRPNAPAELDTVPDDRFLPLTLHFSFIDPPAEPMTPRLADDRLGLILVARQDFSRRGDPDFFVRYAARWRLEPGKPIVFYLDPSIPQVYRPAVKAAVEGWNAAFETAGWVDAIRAEPLPPGADPDDIRYPSIRWITSHDADFGAVGNPIADPRTGEILDADVLVEAGMVEGFFKDWQTLVSPRTAGAMLRPGFPAGSSTRETDSFGLFMATQGSLARLALAARGEIARYQGAPGEPGADELVRQQLVWTILHEVGHDLGLHHNFRASSATPVDRLHDRAWTREHGLGGSVMDYYPVNLALPGEENGDFFPQAPGPYDHWAITYLYTPDAEEAARLARQGARPGHSFGAEVDVYAPGALDPTTNLWDLGSDPLAWSRRMVVILEDLYPRLPETVLTDDARPFDLTAAVMNLLQAQGAVVAPAVKYLGGQYVYRDHAGDPGHRPPFVNVPKAKQQEALAFLAEHAFGAGAFQVPPEVLREMGGLNWDHWGLPATFDGRIDPPYARRVREIQRHLFDDATDPLRLARIGDAELKFGVGEVLTLPELLGGLTEAVWSEVGSAPGGDVPLLRRDLQRHYLERMTRLLLDPPEGTPADARSVARMELAGLARRLQERLADPAAFDASTRAHLEEAAARIQKALEAQLTVAPGGGA